MLASSRRSRRRAVALLAVALLAMGSAPPGAREAAQRWAEHLAGGEVALLVALYSTDGSHRDLATGELARGREALRRYFEARLGSSNPSPRLSGLVALAGDSVLVRLAHDVPGASWPPYTAVLLVREEGGWRVAATRAGGNPDVPAPSE